MKVMAYLTFEVNRTCDMIDVHKDKCPIAHKDRYLYSDSDTAITDTLVLNFYHWLHTVRKFDGVVGWTLYNEPTLVLNRIRYMMAHMKRMRPEQRFRLTTNKPDVPGFDEYCFSNYGKGNGAQLDNRMFIDTGDGKPYGEVKPRGRCRRGMGWEVIIDYFGNWCLCCGDWRNEESIGNIWGGVWDVLYEKWDAKRQTIRWSDQQSYDALPRMCRSCIDKAPRMVLLR